MQMKLICSKRALLIKPMGDLDHHSAAIVREKIDKEFKKTSAINLVFDFGGISFMDSSGIGVIMGRYKLAKTLGGNVVVFGVTEHIKRIMQLSGIDKIVKITNSENNALMLLEEVV